ncbi:MAG TPA: EamA family transporter [Alphaproteobacteria bacterium]|nr:EamA family transporter [Alphaproteobacteria bacterium]
MKSKTSKGKRKVSGSGSTSKPGSFKEYLQGFKELSHKHSFLIFILLATICTSFGQLFLKLGAQHLSVSYYMAQSIIFNPYLLTGIVLYAFGAIFLIYSMKNVNLSYAYPFMSLNFMWVSMLSYFVLGEKIFFAQIIGIIIIIIGVILIGSDKD